MLIDAIVRDMCMLKSQSWPPAGFCRRRQQGTSLLLSEGSWEPLIRVVTSFNVTLPRLLLDLTLATADSCRGLEFFPHSVFLYTATEDSSSLFVKHDFIVIL